MRVAETPVLGAVVVSENIANYLEKDNKTSKFCLFCRFSKKRASPTIKCWFEIKCDKQEVVSMDVLELVRKEGLRRCLSPRTIETYCGCVRQFFDYCKKEPRKITKKDIKDYLDNIIAKKASGSTINVYLNALRFLMVDILNKNFFVRIKYSKIPKRLPVKLEKDEIKMLFDAINNEKQKLIVELMYSAGLRLSELINLKVNDLDLEKMVGWVRHGKGNKDRPFIIAEKLKEKIGCHIKRYNLSNESNVFIGLNGPISKSYVYHIVRNAASKARIKNKVHPHTLRHSFATHLIENGYDLVAVQSLLGHKDVSTTMVYVHIAMPSMIKVNSPFDSL